MTKETKTETTAVAVVSPNENAVPAFLQGVKREDRSNLDTRDLTIPRIKVAQDQSNEVKTGDVPRGALFLNVTGEVLAEFGKPMRFIPLVTSKEYILWRDQQDGGGGLLARAKAVVETGKVRYKWDKPGQTFTTKIKGLVPATWTTKEYIDQDNLDQWGTQIDGDRDSPPAASVHYNYLVMLPDLGNMIVALSLSKSQVKRAKDLNAMLEMSQLPAYARYIRAHIEPEKNDAGQEFFNIRFKPAGVVQDEELYGFAKSQHEYYAAQGFVVDQENHDATEGSKSGGGGKF